MILTCPQCASRFLLPTDSLGEQGRNVKCGSCGEIWHQLPVPEEEEGSEGGAEEGSFDAAMDEAAEGDAPADEFEDIPDAVKPQAGDGADDDEEPDGGDLKAKILLIVQRALPSAVASLLIIFAALLLLHKPIVSAAPSMIGFYSAIGVSSPVPGEGLVFDKLVAKAESHGDDEEIHLSGKVINLTSKPQKVPVIEAVVKDKDGHDIDVVLVKASADSIDGEAEVDFSAVYKNSDEADSVALRFVLRASKEALSKIDEAGDDNSHAPHADENAH